MEHQRVTISVRAGSCTLCRSCQLICSMTHKGVFDPSFANLSVEDSGDAGEAPRIVFLDSCTGCGLCADYCVYGALEQEKEAPAHE